MSQSSDKPILVTGGGGFVGAWFVETAVLSGIPVRAGVRTWGSGARVARFPAEVVLCNVLDPASVARAMEGVRAVVHCAVGNSAVIKDGTRNVMQAALAAGVERVVHLSSVAVYGNASEEFREDRTCRLSGYSYGDDKISAEEICRDFHRQGLPVTMLRPTIVYGPFSITWTVDFGVRLASGRWGNFGAAGEGNCNLVYVGDLVRAIRLAITAPDAVGAVFNINGPEVVTWNQYFEQFNDALGLPPLRTLNPGRMKMQSAMMEPVRVVGKFVLQNYRQLMLKVSKSSDAANSAMQQLRTGLKLVPAGRQLRMFSETATFPNDLAERALGYRPQTSVADGLRYSAGWLQDTGLLPMPPRRAKSAV